MTRQSEIVLWYPARYADELTPPGRAAPSDWVEVSSTEPPRFWLAPPFPSENSERELWDGDIVEFESYTIHAIIALQLHDDGFVFNEPVPDTFECCCVLNGYQESTLATSVDEMIENLRGDLCDPGEYRAMFYTFSDPRPYRFDLASRTFVEVH